MRCRQCQAELNESSYCPGCGCDVSFQKRVYLISDMYYNQGLEKAQIRDLSGAVDMLVRSLKFNKRNIQARNLLGLVYFEMGEAVAALSEWVISDNMQTKDNIAADFIAQLQSNANKLDTINQSIRKYNEALDICRSGHTDTAIIQLKKVLQQNPKLIKAYHLLALVYMHNGEYKKARRVLKKAGRIDHTNSTTLRFLKEIDEQLGTVSHSGSQNLLSSFGNREKDAFTEGGPEIFVSDNDVVIQPPAFRETSVVATLINLCFGLLVGAAVVWFLIVPATRKDINETANAKIVEYSDTMASQSTQIAKLKEQIKESENTVASANEQIDAAKKEVDSYENLLKAYSAYTDGDYSSVLKVIENIDEKGLSVDARILYDSIYAKVSDSLFSDYKNKGLQAYMEQNYQSAAENLQKAMDIKDTDYNVLECLALAYRELGKNSQARSVFEQIVKTFPNSRRATNAQAFIDIIDRETGADTTGGAGTGDTGDTQEPQTGGDAQEPQTGEDTQEPQAGEGTQEPQTTGDTEPTQEGGLGNADDVLGNTQ